MHRPRPPTRIEGRPRLLDFRLGVSPGERSFYLEALGDAQLLAGRSTEAAAAYLEALRGVRGQPLREAHLALKLLRVEQRRGHYSNATAPSESRPACY